MDRTTNEKQAENTRAEIDMEGLNELLSSLPDDVMLEVLMDAGLIDRGEADG